MIGSGIVTLPWTFYHSGILLGTLICFTSFLVSLRTCILVLRLTGPKEDFYDTMRKYWGKPGYLIAVIGTLAITMTACTAYFVIMAQMLYPNILALLNWIFKVKLPLQEGIIFDSFSQSYCAILMYIVMVSICLKRDLSLFILMSSYGAIAIIIIALFILSVGIYSLSNTNYQSVWLPTQDDLDVQNEELMVNIRNVFLINSNFTPLAGVLGIGYFLHPVAVPIVRNNLIQKNNERDLSWGYIMVFISYIVIGVFGYYGFSGVYFTEYSVSSTGSNRPLA